MTMKFIQRAGYAMLLGLMVLASNGVADAASKDSRSSSRSGRDSRNGRDSRDRDSHDNRDSRGREYKSDHHDEIVHRAAAEGSKDRLRVIVRYRDADKMSKALDDFLKSGQAKKYQRYQQSRGIGVDVS